MGEIKKRMLFFFHENPFSNRAGNVTRCKKNIEIFNELGYDIDLVGSYDVYVGMNDNLIINSPLINQHFLIKRKPKDENFINRIKYKILKKIKKSSNYFATPYFLSKFHKIIKENNYDIIFINYEIWSELTNFKELENTKKIVDTHDWMTLNEYYKNQKLDIGKRFSQELQNLDKFDHVITISNDENFVFSSFLGNKVFNIPPYFDQNFIEIDVNKKYDIIFVGSDNPFNIKAINWFLDKVLPLLPSSSKICVIGRVSKYISEIKNVEKNIFVEDLSTFYQASKIAICPMLEGTGIKIKVIEALSYALPVVGTIKAVDGFGEKRHNGCFVSDDPEEFAKNCLELINNQELYSRATSEAKDFFINNFSKEINYELWKKLLVN